MFLALRRRRAHGAVTYAGEANAWECDFLTKSTAIQVCAELTAENRDREIRGVLQAAALPGRRRPLILTIDQRDRIETEEGPIDVRPAWEWMMDEARARPASRHTP